MGIVKFFHRYFPFEQVIKSKGELVIRGLSLREFEEMCRNNPELRLERERNGDIVVLPPFLAATSIRIARLTYQLGSWNKIKNDGNVFSANTGYELPDKSIKCAQISWIKHKRLADISGKIKESEYLQIVPDFIAEILSRHESVLNKKNKILETWMTNGVQLAWLIDPYKEDVHIFKKNNSVQIQKGFDKKMSGENVLPDFELDLMELKIN